MSEKVRSKEGREIIIKYFRRILLIIIRIRNVQ